MDRVFIPKSVTKIEDSAFEDYKNLKEVVIEEGSKLEEIGCNCFKNSRLAEITLPKVFNKISDNAFSGCDYLNKIYVENGCDADLSDLDVPDSTQVGPLPETMVGNEKVWDLRDRA